MQHHGNRANHRSPATHAVTAQPGAVAATRAVTAAVTLHVHRFRAKEGTRLGIRDARAGTDAGARLLWGDDSPAEGVRCLAHSVVVGHDLPDRCAEFAGAGEMNRVERPQFGRFEPASFAEYAIVDA